MKNITIKTNRGSNNSGYLFTIKNTAQGRNFLETYRELRRAYGQSSIRLRGRNPNRTQFVGMSTGDGNRVYSADNLRRSIPKRFAKSFDVYSV